MRNILAIHLFVAASIWADSVKANGGGYVTGGAANTGDIAGFEPKSTESIRMAGEDLHIKLGPKSAKVEILYRMENVTQKRVTVRFGFPVEEVPSVHGLGIGAVLPPASEIEVHSEPLYCKNYRLLDGGNAVKAKWQTETRATDDERFAHLAGWFVSEVSFAPGEVKEWFISFESLYPGTSSSVSDDSFDSASVFKYRLSTASCWFGTIGKGSIILEPDGIDPEELRVIKPVNRFRKVGDRWIWEFTGLEPTLDDDFEVEAQPTVYSYANYGGEHGYTRRGERWSFAHANYSIRASSTLPPEGERRYDPENLKEFQRAWVEGSPGSGVGEWLEIKPKVAKPLTAITFNPGFPDKAPLTLFKANSRPKRIRIELNDDHAFSINIPDSPETFRIPISGYTKPVSAIRMTFEEVWPGSQFEDLCLHNLYLHVRVDQKPEIKEAR